MEDSYLFYKQITKKTFNYAVHLIQQELSEDNDARRAATITK